MNDEQLNAIVEKFGADEWINRRTGANADARSFASALLADGGKGEAVYQVQTGDCWLDMTQEQYEHHSKTRPTRVLYAAPQVECVPREAQPDGWKLVPHEPTKEMLEAGREQWERIGYAGDVWQAMYCAAPTPERAQPVAYFLHDEKTGHWDQLADQYKGNPDAIPLYHRTQESAGVLTDDQIREIWMRETGTTEQDSPLAILDFARAVIAADKEPQP